MNATGNLTKVYDDAVKTAKGIKKAFSDGVKHSARTAHNNANVGTKVLGGGTPPSQATIPEFNNVAELIGYGVGQLIGTQLK